MNKYVLVNLILLSLILYISCSNKDNTVIPEEKPYPSGVPDWNNREYDWIDSSFIQWWEYPKSPKYSISVLDCSPDGNNLIVQDLSYKKVLTFNLSNKAFEFILPGKSIIADWSSSGLFIVFGFESYNKNEIYCIYNWVGKNYYYIPMLDSFDLYSGTVKWWDTDSTFLTTFMKANDKISHIYEVNIHPPYNIHIREDLNYDFEQYNGLRFTFNNDSINAFSCKLEIKNLNNETINSYFIKGVVSPQSQIKIAPNGKYLAFIGSADFTNTKRYELFKENGMGGNLVIINLDELNSGNIVYRLFPDYTNSRHGKFYSQYINIGSWSSDSQYFFHTYYLADSTIQIAKRNIYTGKIELLTDLRSSP